MSATRTVETTRKGVEKLAVEEAKEEQASVILKKSMVARAREAWSNIKEMVKGKKVVIRSGEDGMEVKNRSERMESGEKVVDMEALGVELEDGTVEVLEVLDESDRESVVSGSATGSVGGASGFEFLDCLEGESCEVDLERKRGEARKRKWNPEPEVKKRGRLNTHGWEERERDGKSEKRWRRDVVEVVCGKEGRGRKVVTEEGLPLPDEFRLGLERKGMELNHSGRARNNFGTNKRALTPGPLGGNRESRNWIATFTRAGRLGCKENGVGNHA